ncbi:hypothetical protein HOT49_gp084 [Erwinia phage vB_EamM_Alexandra]|uniref:Uncharacterized protein n=1 Tax=Erwinia phage vB_EamM_Alexandra TaxID=2201424 RepID=A0A2Z4QEZ2_9CAUD|nr:hypothetical protein HOT49_gp084 [Erwinia phage vB_EamM_Alexandra]AWY08361.1 hypothetical protein Alexandra_84 [Erwinia phage vB_EamM_Alexandra]
MELFPYANLNMGSVISLGLLYDTDAPENGEKSLHSAINEAIALRMFVRSGLTTSPGRLQYLPYAAPGFDTARLYPAWIELTSSALNQGYMAPLKTKTRIIPKIKLPPLDARFAGTANTYLEGIATCMLAHRTGITGDSFLVNMAGHNLSSQYNLTQEGWFLCAEYDFGAEIELGSFAAFSMGAAAAAQMILGTQQTYIQALVDDVWTDVIHTYDNLRTTANNTVVLYDLPNTFKAQKFRLVNKAVTWPWGTTGFYPFALQFYGTYTGIKPRTLGKFKHMTALQLQWASSYVNTSGWTFNVPAAPATVQSRYCTMSHYSITDDLKQAANFDILMQKAQYNLTTFGLVDVPTFRVKLSTIVGRGV